MSAPRLGFHDRQHLQRMFVQEKRVNTIFSLFVNAIAPEMRKWHDTGNKNSVWVRNPGVEHRINLRLLDLQRTLEKEIKTNQSEAWRSATDKNDKLVEQYIKGMPLSSTVKEGLFSRNLDGLKALQQRVDNGMSLSDRVWNITKQTKGHVELFLESGMATGRSAEAIGRDMRQMLNNPDKRFRRVRDKNGKLVLSQPMKDYHPGRGVYRSSRMNALRVSATETNMGYRKSDSERWKQMDFVLGFEVHRSPNAHPCPICDALKGKYPKDFIFIGWHPFCICFAVPIVMEHDDFADFLLDDEIPESNIILDIPNSAREWTAKYVSKSGSVPYYVNQNTSWFVKKGKSDNRRTPLEIARKRHADRTLDKERQIREAWMKRQEDKYISKNMPIELKAGSDYLKKENYRFDKQFFDLIDENKPIKLVIDKKGKGSYYSPFGGTVHLLDGVRNKASAWERKAVVYHEFGHAIDWQRNLRNSKELKDLRELQLKRLNKREIVSIWEHQYNYTTSKYEYVKKTGSMSNIAYIDNRLAALNTKIHKIDDSVFTRRGITKSDVLEQIGSVRDTIMSFNSRYGYGHTKAYFKKDGMKEAEYLAHAFENAFIGNQVFKKYLPDVYDEMVTFIKELAAMLHFEFQTNFPN